MASISRTRALEFRGRVTLAAIVAYRGSVRSEKESPTVNWITVKLQTKNEGSKSKVREVISL